MTYGPHTDVTLTIAPISVFEGGGDGESMAIAEVFFDLLTNSGGPENLRWDEGDIGTGTTPRACRVLQGCFDRGTMVTVETAVS